MGQTIQRIIYSVKEAVTNFHITDDFRIEDEYLIHLANTIRSSLIDEEFKSRKLSDEYYQRYCCLEVECVKESCVLDGLTVSSENVLYYADVPSLKKGIGWDNIKMLTAEDVIFSRLNFMSFKMQDNRQYGLSMPTFTLIGNRVYLRHLPTTGTKFLCIVAILEDPLIAGLCDMDSDDEYPVPNVMKLEYLMKRNVFESLNLPVDVINNTNDDTVNVQTKK